MYPIFAFSSCSINAAMSSSSPEVVGKAIPRDNGSNGAADELPALKHKKKSKKKKKRHGGLLAVSSPLGPVASNGPVVAELPIAAAASPIQLRTTKTKSKRKSMLQAKRPLEKALSEVEVASKRPRVDDTVVHVAVAKKPTSFEDAVRFMQKHVKQDDSSESDDDRKPPATRSFPTQGLHAAPGSDDDVPPHQTQRAKASVKPVKAMANNKIATPTAPIVQRSDAWKADRTTPPAVRVASSKHPTAATKRSAAGTKVKKGEDAMPSRVLVKGKQAQAQPKREPAYNHGHALSTVIDRKPLVVKLATATAKPPPALELSSESDDDDGHPVAPKPTDQVTPAAPRSTSLDALLLQKTLHFPADNSSDESDSAAAAALPRTFHLPQPDDDDDDVDTKEACRPKPPASSGHTIMGRATSEKSNAQVVSSNVANKTPTRPSSARSDTDSHQKERLPSSRPNHGTARPVFDATPPTLATMQGDGGSDSEAEAVLTPQKFRAADPASSDSDVAEVKVTKRPSAAPARRWMTRPTVVSSPLASNGTTISKKRKMAPPTGSGAAMLDEAVKVMQKKLYPTLQGTTGGTPTTTSALSKAGKSTFMNALIDSAALDQWNLVEMGRLVRLFCHQWGCKRKKTARFLLHNCPEFVCAEFLEGLNIALKVDQIVGLMRRGSTSMAGFGSKLCACIESDMIRLGDDAFLACVADVVDLATMTQDEIADFVSPLIESANYMADACKLLHAVCEHWPVDVMQSFVQRVLLLNAVFDDLEGDPADMSKYFPHCAFDLPNRMLRDLEDMDENGNLIDFCTGEDDIEYEQRTSADELDALDDLIDNSPQKKQTKAAKNANDDSSDEPDSDDDDDPHVVLGDEGSDDDEVQQWHQGPRSSMNRRRKRSMFILDEASEEEEYESSDDEDDNDMDMATYSDGEMAVPGDRSNIYAEQPHNHDQHDSDDKSCSEDMDVDEGEYTKNRGGADSESDCDDEGYRDEEDEEPTVESAKAGADGGSSDDDVAADGDSEDGEQAQTDSQDDVASGGERDSSDDE
ncbi:hypothetical protein DYB34_000387 [Aphanomyces astaci]|uniref:Uncharacterized protein n=1 Tax=Aphanomyces astaci TaxID=112090 RepID=A0A3R6VJN5_APHAT|nr:hypothetical protein DYB34_000387 [Aphanomyces astaci]